MSIFILLLTFDCFDVVESREEDARSEAARVPADRERCGNVVGRVRLGLRSRRHHGRTLRQDSTSGRAQEPLPALDDGRRCRHAVVDWPAHVIRAVADHHQVRRRNMQNAGMPWDASKYILPAPGHFRALSTLGTPLSQGHAHQLSITRTGGMKFLKFQ